MGVQDFTLLPIKNSGGDTPVMYCLKNNKIEMARCLINTPGVDLDTVDSDGKQMEDIARSVFNTLEQSKFPLEQRIGM